jgi:class 3 adenylate cyclase
MEEKEPQRSNIEKILSERMKLDDVLRSEFQRKVTIMFTDIKGSTSFYEQRGDLDGRLMVHRHNEIVMPCIEQNKGVLIKTIGDATMSRYEDPSDGVRAALQIQLRLRDHNKTSAAGEKIHVRIGLNTGLGIVEEKDVFGDVVNVAARVEALADGGEIFVTEDTYREVKDNDEFIFRFAKASQVRGKKEALKAYRLVWQEEDLNLGKVRGGPQVAARKEGVFVLDASVAGTSLKVSAYERKDGEERAVKNYKEVPYQEEKVLEYARGIVDVLNRANRRGKIGKDLLVKLRELGGLLFDQLVPVEIKERMKSTGQGNLMLNIDDKLVHIPWELLYDGKGFLCHRFSIGRSVSTQQAVSAAVRALHRPLKMQILADPRGDLKASYEEGVAIKNEMASFEDWLDVSLKTSDITPDYAKGKIRNFDILHYAGHAEHNTEHPEQSAWLLKDGRLTAAEIISMAGSRPMPALVFSNACQTGQTDTWKLDENFGDRIFGVANAFLLSGVQHYIGTFWEIPDEAGSLFARSFYRSLVDGATIGEAMRQARLALIQKYGEDTIVWASYMLYGDPTTRYAVAEAAEDDQPEAKRAEHAELATATLRSGDATDAAPSEAGNKTMVYAAVAAAVIVAVAAFVFMGRDRGPSGPAQTVAPLAASQQSAGGGTVDAERRDELIASLAAQYRDGSYLKAKKPTDDWSSRPITMVFMDVRPPEGAGPEQINLLANRVTQALEAEGRVQIVERELLSKLLEELKLSASALADQATALRIGKLLSARIMVTGGLIAEKKGMNISLRFIDTETTAVRKVMNIDAPSRDIDRDTAQNLAKSINEWVKTDFPVRGRVTTLAGETCMVNVGHAHGLKKGDRLEIVKEAKKGTGMFAVTGELEIIELAKDKAQARIVSKMEVVKEGVQVRGKM